MTPPDPAARPRQAQPPQIDLPRASKYTIRERPVAFQAKSTNRKLARVELEGAAWRPRQVPVAPFMSSTYVSIEATCDDTCEFKNRGCYVDAGFTRIHSIRMNNAARGMTPEQVIAEECDAIRTAFGGGRVPQDGARGGRDLRLHVGGDVGSIAGAEMIADEVERWLDRGGGSVFTYTHSWRRVPRSAWGPHVSVLASVEHPHQIAEARAQGYAAAIVVQRFPNGAKAFSLGGTKVIPCPAQTRDATCVECRLCIDRPLYDMGVAIGFEIHGAKAEQTRVHLPVISSAA